jgi:hypothetical protein
MPDLAVTTEPLSLWAAAALLILLLVIGVVVLRRSGSPGSVAALFAVPALVVIAWSAWNFVDHSILRQRAAEREAINARALQLTNAAMAPGSALACIDAGAGEVVEASCEATVFGKPETVAAATAYVEARLRLLTDSLDYSRRADRAFGNTLTQLRRGLEADRYGFVAHVLASRDGCTAETCEIFALLRDAKAVKANINAGTFENNIARYAANWPENKNPSPLAEAPSPTAPGAAIISAVPVTKPIDFPTAASIPAVSIMTEPAVPLAPAAAPAPGPAQAAPARRPAAPPAAAARPQ